ncbi:MAG: hypothetical protein E5X76_19905 [Mesorhizobium sp.]|nr:MAG: hypothetical protein E5X76_19905 [Mesorhizobium sp.]
MSSSTPYLPLNRYFLQKRSLAASSSGPMAMAGAAAALVLVAGSTPALSEYANATSVREVRTVAPSAATGNVQDIVRQAAFSDVHKAIDVMANISPEDDYYIKSDTRDHARVALSLLYVVGAPVPKVLSHDSESVTFSWMHGINRQYLTVSEGFATLLHATPSGTRVIGEAGLKDMQIFDLLGLAGEYVGGVEAA